VWLYDGTKHFDNAQNNLQFKFSKVSTNLMEEHAIEVKKADISDQGSYQCYVALSL
jgi:hypothetical protein